jgi:hypothetical protein
MRLLTIAVVGLDGLLVAAVVTGNGRLVQLALLWFAASLAVAGRVVARLPVPDDCAETHSHE